VIVFSFAGAWVCLVLVKYRRKKRIKQISNRVTIVSSNRACYRCRKFSMSYVVAG
jgi:hypothetical protein